MIGSSDKFITVCLLWLIFITVCNKTLFQITIQASSLINKFQTLFFNVTLTVSQIYSTYVKKIY